MSGPRAAALRLARRDQAGQRAGRDEIDPAGRHALDVGASTGGFTDCLLQAGAAHVVTVDVAYGELDWRLRDGPARHGARAHERTRPRARDLPYAPDLIVADVSFISLTKVLPAVLGCAAQRFDALAMVKPQFEVGRERVGKGGVVRDPADRRAALVAVAEAARRGARRSSASRRRGCPGRRGTARRSRGWPRAAARARSTISRPRPPTWRP